MDGVWDIFDAAERRCAKQEMREVLADSIRMACQKDRVSEAAECLADGDRPYVAVGFVQCRESCAGDKIGQWRRRLIFEPADEERGQRVPEATFTVRFVCCHEFAKV